MVIICAIILSCSGREERLQSVVEGRITVADSIDQSGDYGGIEVLIFNRDTSATAHADTLFYAETDSAGYFGDIALFKDEGFYPMQVTRNNSVVGRRQVILSHHDSLNISAELPQFARTVALHSRQHDALNMYNRVNSQFNRVGLFIQRGAINQDSIPSELRKWGDIFWEVYERNPETFAGRMAAAKSIDITFNLNYENAREKIQQLTTDIKNLPIAATYGSELITGEKGLTEGLAFLDSLRSLTEEKETLRHIDRLKIELLYDSARVDQAQDELAAFQKNYSAHTQSKNWAKYIGYDLEYLAPGDTLPPFSLTTLDGKALHSDSLAGKPFILEISQLANETYKQQYDRSTVIYNLYSQSGLEFVTFPLDPSQTTVHAFFEARGGVKWPVATVHSFDRAGILEKYNVNRTPTRFVVNARGIIVKKLVGTEYQDVIQYIQQTNAKNKENS